MQYLVTVDTFIPYRVSKDYTVKASSFQTAIGRAIRLYRVFLRERNNGRAKRLEDITVKAKRL